MTRMGWKRLLLAFVIAWLAIAVVVDSFHPGGPTGSRLLDALLIAAMATAALLGLGELLEVLWGFLRILSGKGASGRNP